MTPITDAEQNRWRLNAGIVLVALLELACRKGLPPITWQLGSGTLVATVPPSYGKRDERAEFWAWSDALDLEGANPVRLTRKVVHRAKGTMKTKDGRYASVVLLWDEEIPDELRVAV